MIDAGASERGEAVEMDSLLGGAATGGAKKEWLWGGDDGKK